MALKAPLIAKVGAKEAERWNHEKGCMFQPTWLTLLKPAIYQLYKYIKQQQKHNMEICLIISMNKQISPEISGDLVDRISKKYQNK